MNPPFLFCHLLFWQGLFHKTTPTFSGTPYERGCLESEIMDVWNTLYPCAERAARFSATPRIGPRGWVPYTGLRPRHTPRRSRRTAYITRALGGLADRNKSVFAMFLLKQATNGGLRDKPKDDNDGPKEINITINGIKSGDAFK